MPVPCPDTISDEVSPERPLYQARVCVLSGLTTVIETLALLCWFAGCEIETVGDAQTCAVTTLLATLACPLVTFTQNCVSTSTGGVVQVAALVQIGALTSPAEPRYHWYATGLASAVTLRFAPGPF